MLNSFNLIGRAFECCGEILKFEEQMKGTVL